MIIPSLNKHAFPVGSSYVLDLRTPRSPRMLIFSPSPSSPPLHRLEKSRSQRVLWLLEELQVPYEIKTSPRIRQLAPPEFKEIHPLGKAPILTIESAAPAQPIVLAESGLIIEYLLDHYGKGLIPKRFVEGKEGQVGGETEEWLRYRYYMHYAEGSLMPYLVLAILLTGMPLAKTCTSAIGFANLAFPSSCQNSLSFFHSASGEPVLRDHRAKLSQSQLPDQPGLSGKPNRLVAQPW